ncbi:MAG TPA: prolipoprotein diacylglyceryl transferase [Cyclobacteriaceae bacterium]|nr:prolipoprotein diacylglyceryl transferase [Cyclobacteriaceae bacterium]
MQELLIDPAHPGFYYMLFNMLSYLLGFVVLLIAGKKLKLPLLPWLLSITTTFIFFVLGCKMMAMQSADWHYFLDHLQLNRDPGRALFGGLLLGCMGVFISILALKLPWRSLQAFAFALPIGIALHRLGCFIAGCCFGTATEIPWAVQYGTHTHAYRALIPAADVMHTNALHPVQLYEAFLVLLIIPALILIYKKIKNGISLTGISIIAYFFIRFVTGFFRLDESVLWGLQPIQWICLTGMLVFTVLIFWIEKTSEPKDTSNTNSVSNTTIVSYFFFNSLLCLAAALILLPFEVFTIQLAFIPALVLIFIKLFKKYTVPNLRLASISMLALSFVLMSQTLREDDEEEKNERSFKRYHHIYTGFMAGKSNLSDELINCSGDPVPGTRVDYTNRFGLAGLGYENETIFTQSHKGLDRISFGAELFSGEQLDRARGIYNIERTLQIGGISSYVKLDSKKWGTGIGLTAGNFATINPISESGPTSLKRYWLYPRFNLRYGRKEWIYGEIRVGDFFPSAFPTLTTQIAMGMMDDQHRNGIRFGTATGAGFFINPTFYLTENLRMEALMGGFDSILIDYFDQSNFTFAFKLNYQIEGKRRD